MQTFCKALYERHNCLQVFVFFNPARSTKNQHVFALTCWKCIKINVVFSLLRSKNGPRLWKMSLGREFYPSLTLLLSLCVIEHFVLRRLLPRGLPVHGHGGAGDAVWEGDGKVRLHEGEDRGARGPPCRPCGQVQSIQVILLIMPPFTWYEY